MAIAKVIEVQAEGDTIEAAVEAAVSGASSSVRGVQNAYVRETEAIIEDGRVSHYRVNAKITFVVGGEGDVG